MTDNAAIIRHQLVVARANIGQLHAVTPDDRYVHTALTSLALAVDKLAELVIPESTGGSAVPPPPAPVALERDPSEPDIGRMNF